MVKLPLTLAPSSVVVPLLALGFRGLPTISIVVPIMGLPFGILSILDKTG